MIDTHIHLNVEDYSDDLSTVIERAKAVGVDQIFIPAVDERSADAAVAISRQYPDTVYPMLGLHPEEVKADFEQVLHAMKQRLEQSHLFIAIGEVGLDFYWSRAFEKEQLAAFEEQVKWSVEYQLPLMIHCRKGQNEMIHILKQYEKDLPGGVFHCFTGNEKEADAFLQFDKFMLGIGGVLTFKKSHLPEVLPHIPLSRIVLETDGPYMAPVPMRGKRNESAFLVYVVTKMAESYGISEQEVMTQTTINAHRLFRLVKVAKVEK
jgi:hydrolase, tatD family